MLPTRLRRLVRRHRRLVAALLAGTATLLALTGLRGTAPSAAPAAVIDPTLPRTGEAAVPVSLASPALAGVLAVGDVVDLVEVDDTGRARVVSPGARVLELPSTSGALSGGSVSVVMVAVPAGTALDVTAAAAAGDGLTFIRRSAA